MADDIEIYATGNWPTAPPTVQVGHGTRAGDPILTWDLENVIYFKDPVTLADAIAALGTDRPRMSPQHARALFSISTSDPFVPATGAIDPNVLIWIDYPMNRTHEYTTPIGGEWTPKRMPVNTTALPFGFNPADIPFLDETVDWFVCNGWTSVASPNLPYPPYLFQWTFQLAQFGGAAKNPATAPPSPAAIATRRWIEGFELLNDGSGGTPLASALSRAASRTPEGYGLGLRNVVGSSFDHTVTEFGASASHDSWERFYVRLIKLPTGSSAIFYAINGQTSASNFNFLRITTAGILEFTTSVGQTVIGTGGALNVGEWMKIDLFIHFSNGGGDPGTFQVYLNRQLVMNVSTIVSYGIGQNQNHSRSRMGNSSGGGATDLEIDIDDWINAELPSALTGLDWLMGSHVYGLRATGFGPGHNAGAWTGDFRTALQNPMTEQINIANTQGQLSSTTVGAVLEFSMDLNDVALANAPVPTLGRGAAPYLQNGAAAVLASFFAQDTGAANATISVTGAGGTASLGVSVGTTEIWYPVLYRPAGQITPAVMEPLAIRYVATASGGTTIIWGAAAAVEDLGIFGFEDYDATVSPTPPLPPHYTGMHNAPFPRGPWALVGGMPQSSVFVAYGTYTGNSLGQDYGLPYPPCWLYVRPLTGAAGGVRWWSSDVAAHLGLRPSVSPALMPQTLLDPTEVDNGESLVRAVSANTDSNVSPTVYQYVAFCDPGQRFVTNGAIARPTTVASAITPLVPGAAFTPEAAFFDIEQIGNTTTAALYYKGIGHTGAFASLLNATAETNNVAALGAGAITSQTVLHQVGPVGGRVQTSFSAWRRLDGQPTSPSQGVVLALTSYVGDGVSPRVIPVDLGGHYPSYAQVTPHNAVTSFVRDPSHTGTTSSQADTLAINAATAIVAGSINQISVGSAINVLGVTYDVFVIPSCSQTGWDNNGGDYCPLSYGGYTGDPPDPYTPTVPIDGGEDLCVDDWGDPRPDGLPYVPLMPDATQDENQ